MFCPGLLRALSRVTRTCLIVLPTVLSAGGPAALGLYPTAIRLAFTVQPDSVSANQPITPAIEVVVLDDSGNPARNFVGNEPPIQPVQYAGGRGILQLPGGCRPDGKAVEQVDLNAPANRQPVGKIGR